MDKEIKIGAIVACVVCAGVILLAVLFPCRATPTKDDFEATSLGVVGSNLATGLIVEDGTGTVWQGLNIVDYIEASTEPNLPYLYKDPIRDVNDYNNAVISTKTNYVCSKHGRLHWGERVCFSDVGKSYCPTCVGEIMEMYLDKHINPYLKESEK